MMSVVNAVVGSACGAVFLCDWVVSRSNTPRALLNAKRRQEPRVYTDEGYHGPPSEESTPVSTTVAAMKKEEMSRLKTSLLKTAPSMSIQVPVFSIAFTHFRILTTTLVQLG